jgi:GNAT superfamily N-acetyltransferase
VSRHDAVIIRHDLRPGDVGAIVRMHGLVYATEQAWDHTFEAYVAGPLAEFVKRPGERGRIWLAERAGELVGCIAIVERSEQEAQLRWYLVHPSARGTGLGRRLLEDAVAFCRECDYGSVLLWTVSALEAAAHLYTAVGFRMVEQHPTHLWGADVVEEKYLLDLR